MGDPCLPLPSDKAFVAVWTEERGVVDIADVEGDFTIKPNTPVPNRESEWFNTKSFREDYEPHMMATPAAMYIPPAHQAEIRAADEELKIKFKAYTKDDFVKVV